MSLGLLRTAALLLAAVVFALDRVLKHFVDVTLGLTEPGQSVYLIPQFSLTRANNYGVSLGMLTANTTEMQWILVAFTSAIALAVLVWLLRERRGIDMAALGLILGGALGNIVDRATYGFVIDYADLHFGEFRPFLIFNLADAAISVGVAIILARALFMREKPPAEQGDVRASSVAGQGPHKADHPAEIPDA